MNNRKLLIFASFLLLAGCTTDPDMDNNVGGGTSAQTPSAKIVNTSADAAAETLLVYFNDRAVESIESTAAATRTAATRSGVASVDDVLSRLEIVSLERLFIFSLTTPGAKNRPAPQGCINGTYSPSAKARIWKKPQGSWPEWPK